MSQQELVNRLMDAGWLKSESSIAAMSKVDRADFVDSSIPGKNAYLVCYRVWPGFFFPLSQGHAAGLALWAVPT
jgi:hypothetical protein